MVVRTVSQGDQEYPAPRYHSPSEAPHQAPSETSHAPVNTQNTIVYSYATALYGYAPAHRFIFKLYELSVTSTIIFNCMTEG